MPQMGESVTEATVSKWLVKVGDVVKRDQPILEISTDKVDSEVPAPEDGIVKEILVKEGETVPVKSIVAILEVAGTQHTASETLSSSKQKTDNESVSEQKLSMNNKNFFSPVVRQLAKEAGISEEELAKIPGTGAGGRLTRSDVEEYLKTRNREKVISKSTEKAPHGGYENIVAPPKQFYFSSFELSPEMAKHLADNEFTPVPMDIMRKSIAEHMARSKATSPHVYSIIEVDCTTISKFRTLIKEEFQKREGFSLSFTPFFLEAAVKGILEFPIINTSVDGHTIIYKKHIHLGVAVALGNTGLIVPVIKRAEEKSFLGICRALHDLANRARSKKLTPEEVAGGTFTVTNPGVFGTLIGTPIINQPQVAILCLGAIVKKPAVIDGDKIAIRDLCYLTLSYDHRVLDGSVSGQFLSFVKNYLENWDINRNIFT
ncbi:MAG: 2-oxo acid dehydrogenase subunit E2 [Deltaproteobacteria bacterium]|nr:2-oxo acid dehydrogenase subunit E2 [Deltaproteobacteria bacterium]